MIIIDHNGFHTVWSQSWDVPNCLENAPNGLNNMVNIHVSSLNTIVSRHDVGMIFHTLLTS